ncbi:MAG: hypothetical protein NVS4B1_30420 [Ktedonobacteraceae bacterium]
MFCLCATYKVMDKLEKTIELVRKFDSTLFIGGIVVTRHDTRTNLSAIITLRMRQKYNVLVFQTCIPLNMKLAASPAVGKSIAI